MKFRLGNVKHNCTLNHFTILICVISFLWNDRINKDIISNCIDLGIPTSIGPGTKLIRYQKEQQYPLYTCISWVILTLVDEMSNRKCCWQSPTIEYAQCLAPTVSRPTPILVIWHINQDTIPLIPSDQAFLRQAHRTIAGLVNITEIYFKNVHLRHSICMSHFRYDINGSGTSSSIMNTS